MPRWFLCCSSFCISGICFVIVSPGASRRLCFMILAFPRYLHLHFIYFTYFFFGGGGCGGEGGVHLINPERILSSVILNDTFNITEDEVLIIFLLFL